MRWAVGVTTVPGRERSLSDTLRSLATAGFVPTVVNSDELRLGVCRNWVRTLLDLYLMEPKADRYAVFQDDVVARVGLREYLERWFPDDGYLNLYTAYENEGPGVPPTGGAWFRAVGNGRGALGLVFDRPTVLGLLTNRLFLFLCSGRGPATGRKVNLGVTGLDGKVHDVLAASKPRVWEYVHRTSLLQHAGMVSSVGNPGGRKSGSFPGEMVNPTGEVG